jgi:hypothetical protein
VTLPPPLAPYATWLVAYDVDLGGPGTHRGLPSPTLTIVLPLNDPLDVGWSDEEAVVVGSGRSSGDCTHVRRRSATTGTCAASSWP